MYGSVGRSRSHAAGAVGAAFAGVVGGGRREEGEGDTKSKLRKDRPSDSEQAVWQGGRRERERTNEQAISLGRPAGVDVEWRTYIRGAVEREREREMGQIE